MRTLPARRTVRAAAIAILAVSAAVGTIAVVVQAQGGPSGAQKNNGPQDPLSLLPPDERAAGQQTVVADFAAKQSAFVNAFVATGRDLHSLPLAEIATSDRATASLADATAQSTAIVRGTVTNQTLESEGGVRSTIAVANVLAGAAGAGDVTVAQAGGPELNGSRQVLVETSADPLLYVGREYILFLRPCVNPAWSGQFCIDGAGRQFSVIGGAVHAAIRDGWGLDYDGKSPAILEGAVAQVR